MQFGAFYNKDFKILGVIETEVDEHHNTVKSVKYRRGLKVENEITQMTKPPYIAFSYEYKPVKFKRE